MFGAVDGLVTNASLISGLGGGASAHTVVLTGVAALVAGAFSMGTGEYISVTNQNELMHSEVALESQMSSLPRSWAGAASLIAFSLGALVPLLPYLLGLPHLAATLVITAQPW